MSASAAVAAEHIQGVASLDHAVAPALETLHCEAALQHVLHCLKIVAALTHFMGHCKRDGSRLG